MHSSPAKPAGTGARLASSTYSWVLAMGWPMTMSSPGRTCQTLDHTVVSVGPYMFHTDSARASSSSASARGSASPPHSRRLSATARGQPDCSNSCQVVGVACIMVTAWRRIRSSSVWPSRLSCWRAITTLAPLISGRNSSSAAMSKEIVVTASRLSPASQPGAARIDSRKLPSAPWVTSTPLGLPVDPEVKMT
ncbi:Uncharacterised protein [Achromobacter xylosoxidans]|nr:Uncharacterised protein [Achromobacter xylosoxidans]